MKGETHLAKAVEAAEGQTIGSERGIYDQAAKKIVSDRQILARIVKECVAEAAPYSEAELEQMIPGDIQIAVVPVDRDDAAADPGAVRQENTEDGTVHEGKVCFDILFTLELPDSDGPVLLIINVEVQNRANLSYPLERRAMVYASRLVGRQGTDYANCKKVYSIWIVSVPQKKEAENTLVKLVTARQHADGSFEAAPEAAQVAEVWFLNLGEPDDERLKSAFLKMLDTAFSARLTAEQKRALLQEEFGLRMTADIAKNLEDMKNMELAIEVRARDKWMARGLSEGRAEGLAEGRAEGLAEGRAEGLAEGRAEGLAEGRAEGLAEGLAEGRAEGRAEGLAEGRAEGMAEGRAEGMAEGLIRMGLALKGTRPTIMDKLVPFFSGNKQEAESALDSYIQEHPQEAAYLED